VALTHVFLPKLLKSISSSYCITVYTISIAMKYHIFILIVAPYNATITEVVVINMVTYTCYADGGPGNTYEWIRLRNNLVVSSIQELILDNTDPLDGDNYQCTITNDGGNITVMTTLNGEIKNTKCKIWDTQ